MKKAPSKPPKIAAEPVTAPRPSTESSSMDEMRPHYDFDYSKSRPNRFVSRKKT
jgi:hypothetical protein